MFSYSSNIICGVDLGSHRFKIAAGVLDKRGDFSLLDYAGAKSSGMSAGLVTDISSTSRTLKQTVGSLEDKIKHKIKRVYVNINAKDLILRCAGAVMPLCDRGNKIVTNADINLINSQACSLNLKLDEEIIHKFSHRYILDEHNYMENPKGLYGHKLAVDLYLIAGKLSHIENIVRLINQAGFEVEDIVFSGVAASLAVLDKNLKNSGCVLIDIGADLTQVLVFKDNILRFSEIINYGGNNIASAISEVLRLPFTLAEEIKDAHGAATSKDIGENEEVMVRKDDLYQPIKRRSISGIIEPEVTQLLVRLKEKIDVVPCLKGIDYPVIMSGGTSLMEGLLELTESILGVPVKLGIPKAKIPSERSQPGYGKDLFSFSNRSVIYSTVIGLVIYGFNARKEKKLAIFQSPDKNILTYVTGRVKDIYSEYF